MSDYIDYDDIFTHSEADVYFLSGGRGIGKTFGAREKAIKRYDKAKEKYGGMGRFVTITRFAKNKERIQRGFFEKLQQAGKYRDYDFWWKQDACYRAPKGSNQGELIGYSIALTDQGITKEETFAYLKHGTVLFDEVAIDRRDTFHRYLQAEYDFYFLSLLKSVLRDDVPDDPATCKIIMMANSVDLLCPYYEAFGIDLNMLLNYGKYWCNDKTVLFINSDIVPSNEDIDKTIVGRLSRNTEAAKMIFANKYENMKGDFIAKKTPSARYVCGLVFNGDVFGLWYDGDIWYVNTKNPRGQGTIYTLTLADNAIDYRAVKKADNVISNVVRLHYAGRVRYDNQMVQAKFLNFLRFVGVV